MNRIKTRSSRLIGCLFLGLALATFSQGQKDRPAQTAGVDNTNTGAYHALAQLCLQAFQKGENAKAATLARILERTWDKGERDLAMNSTDLWREIDKAMDLFIKPIIGFDSKVPDPSQVQSAYNDYLEKLKRAD